MTEEPTQQIRLRPENTQVTPALPPGLDPTRGRRRARTAEEVSADDMSADPGTEATGVLHLDELFATEPDNDRHVDRPSIESAPTWTAMPIVPIRSEPYTPPASAAPPASATAGAAPVATPPPTGTPPATADRTSVMPHPTGPPVTPARPARAGQARARTRATAVSATTARRLSTDLAALRRRTNDLVLRSDTWLRRDDNALMVLTAFIACLLILIVASVGH